MKNIENINTQYGVVLEARASSLTQGISGPIFEAGMHRYIHV